MADPLVVTVMRQFKAALLVRETAEMQELARRWLPIEGALEGQIDMLAGEFAAEREAGRAISQAKLFRMQRYQTLLAQLRREVGSYTDYASGLIERGQLEWAGLGIEHAQAAISVSATNVAGTFTRLPVEAVRNIVAVSQPGGPVGKLLTATWPEAADGLSRALIQGTALGWHPTKTAAAMRQGMALGLNRALTIARTEQIRAYREGSRQQYEESGVVSGFRRLVAHDDRTCMACLMAEGEVYPVGEHLRDHTSGRCAMVPIVKGMKAPAFETGKTWFRQQDADTQERLMGRDYYQSWRRGEFRLEELVQVKHNATWGDSVQVTPLSKLAQGKEQAA